MLEPVELFKQDLAIEADLQGFVGFVYECVCRMGGSGFAATITLLKLMQSLRLEGAATGSAMPVSLVLQGHTLLAQWGGQQFFKIVDIDYLPPQEEIDLIHAHMQRSTAVTDPAILLQRNIQMERQLNEVYARTQGEIASLQRTAEKRQNELHESMRQAETDPLTGLLNRRAFDDRLSRAFHHTMRQKIAPLSLALFDLDFFKNINDEFGHQFGDAHLNKMAQILLSVIRENVDFAFRFGGDEFALLIFADHSLACDKAKKVQRLMENKVSIGIAAIGPETPDSFTPEEFFLRADTALYAAKDQGRGRAVVDVCIKNHNLDCISPCPKMVMQANG
ncbi:MAG: GGDEF domain-containing protein [Gallionellaceae bacterium]